MSDSLHQGLRLFTEPVCLREAGRSTRVLCVLSRQQMILHLGAKFLFPDAEELAGKHPQKGIHNAPLPALRACAPYQHPVDVRRSLALSCPRDRRKDAAAAVIRLTVIKCILDLFIIRPNPSSDRRWLRDAHYINDIHMVGRNQFACSVVRLATFYSRLALQSAGGDFVWPVHPGYTRVNVKTIQSSDFKNLRYPMIIVQLGVPVLDVVLGTLPLDALFIGNDDKIPGGICKSISKLLVPRHAKPPIARLYGVVNIHGLEGARTWEVKRLELEAFGIISIPARARSSLFFPFSFLFSAWRVGLVDDSERTICIYIMPCRTRSFPDAHRDN